MTRDDYEKAQSDFGEVARKHRAAADVHYQMGNIVASVKHTVLEGAISAGAGICWNCYKRWDDKQPTEWEKAYIDACRAEDLDKIYVLLKNAEKKGW